MALPENRPFVIFAGGQERILTRHVLERVRERGISVEWIEQALSDPVAVVNDEGKEFHELFWSCRKQASPT